MPQGTPPSPTQVRRIFRVRAPAGPHEPGAVGVGVALMIGGTLLVPVMDAIAKLLGPSGLAAGYDFGEPLGATFTSWARFVFQLILLIAFAALIGPRAALRPRKLGLAAIRGALIAGATICFFLSLQVMGMAEAVSIFFVEPLILTALSALILGEAIGWRRVAAVVVGLLGALIIIRPNFIAVGWPAMLPLGAAFCFAFYMVFTKIAARDSSALELQLWAGAWSAALLTAALALGAWTGWPETTPESVSAAQWALLGLLGVIATVGHLMIVAALARAPASLAAPFTYLEIVSATALGFLLFGDTPDAATWLGLALIISAGAFTAWRERT